MKQKAQELFNQVKEKMKDTEYLPAQSDQELGYFGEGEPSDEQLVFQDAVDNLVHEFLNNMMALYANAASIATNTEGLTEEEQKVEWDIGKITSVRERVQDTLELPDLY